MTVMLQDYQLGIIGAVIAMLLLAVFISIGLIIFLLNKVKRSLGSPDGASHDVCNHDSTHETDLTTVPSHDINSKSLRDNTDSVVYDEVQDFMNQGHPFNTTAAANTATEIKLKINSAYRVPNIQNQ